MINKEETVSFTEASKILGKSKRTLSRYIKKKLIIPEKIKSQKGIKYCFNLAELESLKKPDTTGQTTGQNKKTIINNDTLSFLKDTMKLLQKQLKAKDTQIKQLLERQREANILMGQLQNKVFLLEDKSKGKRPDKKDQTDDMTSQIKWQGINDFLKRLFKRTN
jgi:DNA-binding transcriptional MerR regulator